MCRILDNWNGQFIIISQIPGLAAPLGDALDLLNLLDFKWRRGSEVAFDKKCDEDGPLRVCVDAAACTASEGGVEEGGASRGFVSLLNLVEIKSNR
jgi:hypothetical protein